MTVRINVTCNRNGPDFPAPDSDPTRCVASISTPMFDDVTPEKLVEYLRAKHWDIELPGIKGPGVTLCPWHHRNAVECPSCKRRDYRHEKHCTNLGGEFVSVVNP